MQILFNCFIISSVWNNVLSLTAISVCCYFRCDHRKRRAIQVVEFKHGTNVHFLSDMLLQAICCTVVLYCGNNTNTLYSIQTTHWWVQIKVSCNGCSIHPDEGIWQLICACLVLGLCDVSAKPSTKRHGGLQRICAYMYSQHSEDWILPTPCLTEYCIWKHTYF